MLCDVWTAFLSTRSPRPSRKLWSSCRGNGFHCTMKTDVIRCQQACSIAEFGWILYGSSQWNKWNELHSDPIHPYVTEAQFPLLQLSDRCLCTQNIATLTQIYKKRQYVFFVSTTVCKGKGHTITRLCSYRGETISPTHSQPGARRRQFVSTMLQADLPSGKNCYSLYRRLSGPRDRSWGHGKSSPSSGFDSRTVQPVPT